MKSWILASVFAALPLQAQVVLEYVSDAAIPDGGGDVGLQYSVDVTVPFSQIADLNIALHVVPVDSEDAWNGDLYAYVQHGDQLVVLLNRIGRNSPTGIGSFGSPDSGLHVTLDDQAAAGDIHVHFPVAQPAFPAAQRPLVGTWQPDGRTVADPANTLASDPRTTSLAQFNGLNPNGRWTLFIGDYGTGGAARLTGWSLEIAAVPEPVGTTATAMTLVAAALWRSKVRRRSGGSPNVER
jgi:hypothetical protein